VPRLGLASLELSNASGSRLGLDTEGLRLGRGSKRLGLLNRNVDRGISVSINFISCFYFFTGVGMGGATSNRRGQCSTPSTLECGGQGVQK